MPVLGICPGKLLIEPLGAQRIAWCMAGPQWPNPFARYAPRFHSGIVVRIGLIRPRPEIKRLPDAPAPGAARVGKAIGWRGVRAATGRRVIR